MYFSGLSGRSFRQTKVSSLLTLDADHRAIGDSLVCLSVQRDTDRKAGRAIVPNDLNAADCLAAGPLSNGFQALFSESSVAHPDCSKSRHLKHFLEAKRAPQPGVCGGPSPGEIGWGCHFLGRQAAKRRPVTHYAITIIERCLFGSRHENEKLIEAVDRTGDGKLGRKKLRRRARNVVSRRRLLLALKSPALRG
jgi:hypothetical protein